MFCWWRDFWSYNKNVCHVLNFGIPNITSCLSPSKIFDIYFQAEILSLLLLYMYSISDTVGAHSPLKCILLSSVSWQQHVKYAEALWNQHCQNILEPGYNYFRVHIYYMWFWNNYGMYSEIIIVTLFWNVLKLHNCEVTETLYFL